MIVLLAHKLALLSLFPCLTHRYTGSARHVSTPGDGTVLSKADYDSLTMNGKEVYKFATREVPKVLKEALEVAELEVEHVDWLLLHQANIRIMEIVAKRLGIPMSKVITNLASYGNTSAGSIPLALDEADFATHEHGQAQVKVLSRDRCQS